MLLQIREYIKKEKVVSSQQIARTFGVDEHTLQPILNIWIAKGVIRPYQMKASCSSQCFRCKGITSPTFYQLA